MRRCYGSSVELPAKTSGKGQVKLLEELMSKADMNYPRKKNVMNKTGMMREEAFGKGTACPEAQRPFSHIWRLAPTGQATYQMQCDTLR